MKRKYDKVYEDLFYYYIDEFYKEKGRSRIYKYLRRISSEEKEFRSIQEDFIEHIEKVLDEIEYNGIAELRPDARLFLLINFHQMIIRPIILISASNEKTHAVHRKNLMQIISDDIHMIVNHSRDSDNKEKEISGHCIISSIDKLWPKLKFSGFNIWGD